MSDQGTQEPRYSRNELVERIHQSYNALEEVLASLSPEQLAAPDPSGWAVKDHLIHLSAWENGITALLNRQDRYAAMQVPEAGSRKMGFDEINDLIYQRNAHLSAKEALEAFRSAHRQMIQTLNGLSDEDLYKPYAAYLTDGSTEPGQPVMNWIAGNTFGHYDEHLRYILELLGAGAAD